MNLRRRLATLRAHPHPIRLIASRLLWRSGLCRHLLIERPDFRLRFFPSSLSATYWANPDDRLDDERMLSVLLRPGDTYVDVGANIGALALRAAAVVGDSGTVYAMEAHPRIYRFLVENVSLNGKSNVHCLNVAVGNDTGALTLSDGTDDDQNHVIQTGGVTVAMRTLDELLSSDTRPIALLKIDVEGYELPALQGATTTLLRTRAVLFELWETHIARYGYSAAEILSLLRGLGFETFRVRGNSLSLLHPHYTAARCENHLALRDPQHFCKQFAFEIA